MYCTYTHTHSVWALRSASTSLTTVKYFISYIADFTVLSEISFLCLLLAREARSHKPSLQSQSQ